MAIEHIARHVILNDTQANVEATSGALAELYIGRDTSTGALGYSIDNGENWTWLPISSGASTLDALSDVTITLPASGQTLQYDGAAWVNVTPTNTGKYRQFLYTVISGNPTFLTDNDGNILTVALDLE